MLGEPEMEDMGIGGGGGSFPAFPGTAALLWVDGKTGTAAALPPVEEEGFCATDATAATSIIINAKASIRYPAIRFTLRLYA